jgi:SHS2 domain-containing protein
LWQSAEDYAYLLGEKATVDFMAYSYNYLPDIAIADVAFEAAGDTPEELFRAAALAAAGVMIRLADITVTVQKTITIQAETLEDLLYQWLSELIYLKDVERVIFVEFDLTIKHIAGLFELAADCGGGEIDPAGHELGQDVKAVTYHLFEIKEVDGKFEARVVLDI